jgi:type IV pilus assembly protein PilC
MLCRHLHATAAFKKQVRSVLLLPMCTLAIFFVVLAIVLMVIVPKYADLFASTSSELPAATRMLLRMNSFVSSYYFLGTLFVTVTVITVIYRATRHPAVKMKYDKNMLRVPFLGSLIKNISQVCYLRSLALLLQGGMPLVAALSASKQAVDNDYVQAALDDCIESVQAGRDMSYAMQLHAELFSRDLVSLITVGEETGNLSEMISRAAELSAERVRCLLQRFTYSVQPAVMIILGLLVAALICAVYIPLFNLADLAIA